MQAAALSQPVPPSPRLRALQTARDSWLEPLSCPRTSLPLPHRLLLQDAEGEAEGSQQPSHPCPPSGVWSQTQKSRFCSLMPPKPLPSLSEAVVEATASLSCRVWHSKVILWLAVTQTPSSHRSGRGSKHCSTWGRACRGLWGRHKVTGGVLGCPEVHREAPGLSRKHMESPGEHRRAPRGLWGAQNHTWQHLGNTKTHTEGSVGGGKEGAGGTPGLHFWGKCGWDCQLPAVSPALTSRGQQQPLPRFSWPLPTFSSGFTLPGRVSGGTF